MSESLLAEKVIIYSCYLIKSSCINTLKKHVAVSNNELLHKRKLRMRISRDDVRNRFIKKVEDLSGENIYKCYQCGKCSAGCPIADHMDILPHQIIRLIQLGSDKEVRDAKTFWLCSSCLQCAEKCPKGVDVAKLMDTLRELLMRDGVDKMELKKMTDEMWKKIPQQAIVARFRKSNE